MGAIADLVAWLDDVVPGEREQPPKLMDPASQAALDTAAGQAIVTWIGLRDGGVGYEEAAVLWKGADDDERTRFLRVLFARRRTLRGGVGEDIGEMWCDEGMAHMMTELGVDAIRDLTLDQLEFLGSGGRCDGHADPSHKALMEAQRIWEAQQKAAEANGDNRECPAQA